MRWRQTFFWQEQVSLSKRQLTKGSSAAVGGGSGEAQHVAHLAQAAPEPVAAEGFQLGGIEFAGEVGQCVMGDEAGLAVGQDAPWLNYRRQKLSVILSPCGYEKADLRKDRLRETCSEKPNSGKPAELL